MNWRFFVALRYFNSKSRERFISIVGLISVFGVAVGVSALIIVIAVMSGFNCELKDRIIGTTPHIFVGHEGGVNYSDPLVRKLLSRTKDVIGFSPLITGQVIVRYKDSFTGAVLSGIEEESERAVTDIKKYTRSRPSSPLGEAGILIGSELAKQIGAEPGCAVLLVSAFSGQPQSFKVVGVFHTGLYSFDANNAFISLRSAQRLFGADTVTAFTARIKDAFKAGEVKRELVGSLRSPYFVRTWMDMNKNLFGALLLEKIAMFVLLALIVLVACFNIASVLIMRAMERTKDIGVLKAIGASRHDIRVVFTVEGLLIGLTGTILGLSTGLLVVWLQKTYGLIKLPSDVYYIDTLPVALNWHDPAIIAAAAVLLSLAAAVYPSSQAGRLDVIEALRYE